MSQFYYLKALKHTDSCCGPRRWYLKVLRCLSPKATCSFKSTREREHYTMEDQSSHDKEFWVSLPPPPHFFLKKLSSFKGYYPDQKKQLQLGGAAAITFPKQWGKAPSLWVEKLQWERVKQCVSEHTPFTESRTCTECFNKSLSPKARNTHQSAICSVFWVSWQRARYQWRHVHRSVFQHPPHSISKMIWCSRPLSSLLGLGGKIPSC